MLCGHVPYHGWDREKVSDAILKGIRPYKPKAAAHLGLVDEIWGILQRCWDERPEARPDLQVIRACLDEVTPMWHARKHFSADDTTSLYPPSHYTSSSSLAPLSTSPSPAPSPSPSPAPPSPSPSPSPSLAQPLNRLHNYPQQSTTHYTTLSLHPSQPQPQRFQDRASSSRNPR